jgi:hypothetical protein
MLAGGRTGLSLGVSAVAPYFALSATGHPEILVNGIGSALKITVESPNFLRAVLMLPRASIFTSHND